ncbi:MAG: histidine kinase [Bacteroidales bacterium]|nr:histidine kinase [Bacteroidales bacterium]
MKKYLFCILLLLVYVTNTVAQNEAILKGKIDNYKSQRIYLTVYRYNPETVTVEPERLSKRLNDDGSFLFLLEDLRYPYTKCSFSISGGAPVILSPGDTINYYSNYWTYEESIIYRGRGAEKNNYLREKYLEFGSQPLKSLYTRNTTPGSFKLIYQSRYKEMTHFLYQYEGLRESDSSFYNYERAIIDFKALTYAYSFFKINHKKYPDNAIPDYFKSDFLRVSSVIGDYLYASEAREFLSSYVRYNILKEGSGRYFDIPPEQLLEWSGKQLTGETRRTYQAYLVNKLLDDVNTDVAKIRLIEFFDSKVYDKELKDYLANQYSKLKESSLSIPRDIGTSAKQFLFISLIIIALFFLLRKLYFYLGKKGIRVSGSKFIRYLVYTITGVILIIYLGEMIPYWGPIAIFDPLIIIAMLITHIKVLIPKLAFRDKKIYYWLSVFGLLTVSIALFFLTDMVRGSNITNSLAYDILQLQTWMCLALALSWIYYYVLYLEQKKTTGIRKLIDDGIFNWEYAIATILVLFINMVWLANANTRLELLPLVNSYTLITIFLVLNYGMVPGRTTKRDIMLLSAGLIIILFVQSSILILTESLQSMLVLREQDVNVHIFDTMSIRYGLDISNLLITILLFIPAFFYNYIKKLIRDQNRSGLRLFRQKEAELIHLRSQVNPHFLFNSLNTIYSYALKEKNDSTAEPISRLAKLMRFMIDDMDREYIPVRREAEYIEDYIQLQLIRSSVKHDIKINLDIVNDDVQIAPMLLIPFVENAFKHGINPGKKSALKIDLLTVENKIQFVVENEIKRGSQEFEKEKGFGIGIENVKRRLEYIYPGKHNLSIAETADCFIVILDIAI